MTSKLPAHPSLEHLKHQARDLQRAHQGGDPAARARVEAALPDHQGRLALAKAQTVIAREHGLPSWPQLRAEVERRLLQHHQAEVGRAAGLPDGVLERAVQAVRAADRNGLAELLRRHPRLTEVQVKRAPGSNLLHEACGVSPEAIGRPARDVIEVIDLLLEAGIDVRSPYGLPEGGHLTPTFAAVRSGSIEVLRHVLERGGGPDGMYSAGPEAIRLLHQHGANLEQVAYDETPLLHNLKNRNVIATRTLLELGADPNHADSRGATPLHYAVRQYEGPEVIELLLAHGAAKEARSNKGITPLDIAIRMGRRDVVALLGGSPGEWHEPEGPESVRLLPFFHHEPGTVHDAVAFYERLGFSCVSHDYDHGFAKMALGAAILLNDEGAEAREDARGEGLLVRCPLELFAAVRAAAQSAAIAHAATTSELRLDDASGFQLIFRAEPGRSAASPELILAVADLPRAAAFYQELGFQTLDAGDGLGEGVALQWADARLHLRQRPGLGAGRGVYVWLVCNDIDRRYRRLSARMPVDPPMVAFHGDIVLNLRDPDGHSLTFSAPATDI
jgi:ankyrin repeat protein